MKKNEVKTKFNFSYGHLKQLADNLLQLLDRDIVEHTTRGFNPTKRTAFVKLINIFDACPDDEQLLGIRESATQAKDDARAKLEKQMRTIFLMAKNAFTSDSGKYREFGNTDLSTQTDEEVVRNAKIIITTATKYLTQLADEGLTTAVITTLSNTKKELDDAIDAKIKAVSNKDLAAETRIEAANNLYDMIVKYCDNGKDLFIEVNEAKYNDYVIYNTINGTKEEIIDPPVM